MKYQKKKERKKENFSSGKVERYLSNWIQLLYLFNANPPLGFIWKLSLQNEEIGSQLPIFNSCINFSLRDAALDASINL